jgi:hypothetical protein
MNAFLYNFVFGILFLLSILAVVALPVGLSVLTLIWLTRRWVPTPAAKAVAAVAFTIGPAYFLWRMEWFDVWRHGVPPMSYLLVTYVPYLTCFAVAGWWLASRLLRRDVSLASDGGVNESGFRLSKQ